LMSVLRQMACPERGENRYLFIYLGWLEKIPSWTLSYWIQNDRDSKENFPSTIRSCQGFTRKYEESMHWAGAGLEKCPLAGKQETAFEWVRGEIRDLLESLKDYGHQSDSRIQSLACRPLTPQ
jgi:hypothetical protein